MSGAKVAHEIFRKFNSALEEGNLDEARHIFDASPKPGLGMLNKLIKSYLNEDRLDEAANVLLEKLSLKPSKGTIKIILDSFARQGECDIDLLVNMCDAFLETCGRYDKCGEVDELGALILAASELEKPEYALDWFYKMLKARREPTLSTCNALVVVLKAKRVRPIKEYKDSFKSVQPAVKNTFYDDEHRVPYGGNVADSAPTGSVNHSVSTCSFKRGQNKAAVMNPRAFGKDEAFPEAAVLYMLLRATKAMKPSDIGKGLAFKSRYAANVNPHLDWLQENYLADYELEGETKLWRVATSATSCTDSARASPSYVPSTPSGSSGDSLRSRVIEIMRHADKPLTAIQIAKACGRNDAKEVNRVLDKDLKGLVWSEPGNTCKPLWHLVSDSGASATSPRTPKLVKEHVQEQLQQQQQQQQRQQKTAVSRLKEMLDKRAPKGSNIEVKYTVEDTAEKQMYEAWVMINDTLRFDGQRCRGKTEAKQSAADEALRNVDSILRMLQHG
eukprot:TRINITY_DN6357_c0_g1_i1.p1 TRINITY_DN6357_c0_g1~~TRINITY_DN6357_c0_g1_i1.p1  ORF type:complete len:502 (+),score=72.59 TRINITY_DN6357_c0_g1_i1:79-1584(+)